jgi:integrase
MRMKRGNKPLTAKARIKELRLIQDFGIKRKLMSRKSVSEYLPELRNTNAEIIRTFKIEDVQTLLALVTADRQKYKHYSTHAMTDCYVNIAAYCGLRYGEIQALTIDNVDFANNIIRVRHSLNDWDELKEPKTRSGIRDVAMPEHVVRALKIWMAQFYKPNDRGLIFRTPRGKMMGRGNFHYKIWRPLLQRAGFTGDIFHFHALRHFYASWLIKHGMALPDVANALGHKRFDTTLQIYAHSIDANPQRLGEMRRIAGLLTFQPDTATP